MNTPESAPVPRPWFDRFLRGVARLGLAAALTFLLTLAVISVSPFIATALETLISPESKLPQFAGILVLIVLVVAPISLLWLAHRKRWGESWPGLAAGYLILAPVFVWLAWDEPAVRYPVSLDELCPAGPQAAESWTVTLAYTARNGQPAPRTYVAPKFTWGGASPDKPAEWQAYLEKNRDLIHATWKDLPERTWLAELNAFPAIGDLMPASPSGPLIKFQPLRTVSQIGCAEAGLLALEGKGDEAMDTLLPILEVGRKLEPTARSLVRFMLARVVQKLSLNTARFILDHAAVSPDRKARLAAVLQGGSGGPAGARRMLFIEYAFTSNYFLSDFGDSAHQRALWKRGLLGVFRLVYNPVATVNLQGQYTKELADLAERRELAGFGTRAEAFVSRNSRPHFKNLVGRLLISMATPAYGRVLDTYWKIEDLRTALAADVAK